MANQNAKFIDITRTYVPLDPKSFPKSMHGTTQEDSPEQKIPVMAYEARNILPSAHGYGSYFGVNRELGIDALPARCDKLFIVQNDFYANVLVALTESGIYIKKGAATGAWTQALAIVPPVDPLVHYEWTVAVIKQKLYVYRQGYASYQRIESDLAAGVTVTSVVPTFLNMAGQVGIFRAGGRLGFWDSSNATGWSNLDDFSDFTPSLQTLANVMTFADINGKIVTIQPHGAGYMIYCTKSVIYVRPDEAATFGWDPHVVFSDNGIAYPRQVTVSTPDTAHFVKTTVGLYKIENAKEQVIVPEVTDVLEKLDTPLYLRMMEGRYLFLEILDPEFLESLVQFSVGTVDEITYVYPGVTQTLAEAVADEILQGTNMCLTLDQFNNGQYADQPADPGDKKTGTGYSPKWVAYISKKGVWGDIAGWTNTPVATIDPFGVEANQCPLGAEGNLLSSNNTTSSGKTVLNGSDLYIDGIWTMERFVAVQQAVWDLEQDSIDNFFNQLLARTKTVTKVSNAASPAPVPTSIDKQLIGDYARRYTKGVFGFSKCEFWLTRACIESSKVYRIKRNITESEDTRVTAVPIGYANWYEVNGYGGPIPNIGSFAMYGSIDGVAAAQFPSGYILGGMTSGDGNASAFISADGYSLYVYIEKVTSDPWTSPYTAAVYAIYQGSAAIQILNLSAGYTYNPNVVAQDRAGRYRLTEIMVATNSEEPYNGNPITFDTGYCTLTGWDYTKSNDTPGFIAASACSAGAEFPPGSTVRQATAMPLAAEIGNDGSFCSIPFQPVTIPGSPPVVVDWPTTEVTVPSGTFLLQDGSIAPVYPILYGALVYDTFLKKWGRMDQSYRLLLDYSPINNADTGVIPFSAFGIQGGILAGDNKIKLFDDHPTDSYVTYGKVGYYRLGMTSVEEVHAQFASNCTGYIRVETSLNATSNIGVKLKEEGNTMATTSRYATTAANTPVSTVSNASTSGTKNDTTSSTQVQQGTQTTSGTTMGPEALAALNNLIAQLLGGGTQQMAQDEATRRGEINTVQANRAGYSKEAAFADAQGLIAQTLRQSMEQLVPSITRAAEGAGTSGGALRALLLQDAATRSSQAASAAGVNAAGVYGNVNASLSNTLEALTRPNDAVTNALISALNIAKGSVNNSTTNTSGVTQTTGTGSSNSTGNSQESKISQPITTSGRPDTSISYYGPSNANAASHSKGNDMSLSFGGPVYTQRNDPDMPSIYASEEEWKSYRALQALKRGPGATNTSGMTPQEMEANVGTVDPDPLKQKLMDLVTAPDTVFNAATIGQMTGDPTYSQRVAQPTGGDVTTTKVGEGPSEEDTILAMAFPEVFLKQPPTGKVNTKGGVERVNARTSEHGVRAIEKDGKIYMTNIGSDGSVNKGTGSPNSVLGDGLGASRGTQAAPDTPAHLNSSIEQLKSAPDLATAQGILMNINQTIAQQSNKLSEDALKFAATRVGLPNLEAELSAAIAADKADPNWYPGIGDSPITQEIRQQIAQANNAANVIAKNYLTSNNQAAALRAMEENSKILYENIKRKEEFSARRQEIRDDRQYQADATRAARNEDRIAQEERRIEMEIGPLDATRMQRMAILDPSSKKADGSIDQLGAQKTAYALKKRNAKDLQEALDLPDQDLPAVALAGNEYAMTIVVANELRDNPKATEQQVRDKMAIIKQRAIDPAFEQQADTFRVSQFTSQKDKDAAKEAIKQKRIGSVLNKPDAATRRLQAVENFNIALQMERAAVTANMTKDAGSFIDPQGPLGKAMEEAPGGAVATVADIGASLWNSLPFTPEVETADLLRGISSNALRVYEENPDTIHTASFIGGMFVPVGLTMKGLGAMRAGMKGVNWFNKAGREADLAKANELFAAGKGTTGEYRSAMRSFYGKSAINQAIDAVAAEAALVTMMNKHPFMEDYFDDPVRNFTVGIVAGGVLGAGIGHIADRFVLKQATSKLAGEALDNTLGKLRGISSDMTGAVALQSHRLNIKSLDNIIAEGAKAGKTFDNDLTMKTAENLKAQTILLEKKTFDSIISSEMQKLGVKDLNVYLKEVAERPEMFGVDKISFLPPSSLAAKTIPAAKTAVVAERPTLARTIVDKVTGKTSQKSVEAVFFPNVGTKGAYGGVDAAVHYAGAAAKYDTVDQVTKTLGKMAHLAPTADNALELIAKSSADAQASYIAWIGRAEKTKDVDFEKVLVGVEDAPALTGMLSIMRERAELAGKPLRVQKGKEIVSMRPADVAAAIRTQKVTEINTLIAGGIPFESIAIKTNTPAQVVEAFAAQAVRNTDAFDEVIGKLQGKVRMDRATGNSITSMESAKDALDIKYKPLRLEGNLKKNPYIEAHANLSNKQMADINNLFTEQIMLSSKSQAVRELGFFMSENSTMFDMLNQMLSKANQEAAGTRFINSFDFYSRNMKDLGPVVSAIAKQREKISNSMIERVAKPIQVAMESVVKDPVAVVEFNTFKTVNDSVRGWRTIDKDGYLVTREIAKDAAGKEVEVLKPVTSQGKPYRVVTPVVKNLIKEIQAQSAELRAMHNAVRQIKGVGPINDIGLWLPPFNPIGKYIAYVWNEAEDVTQILWARSRESLADTVNGYRKYLKQNGDTNTSIVTNPNDGSTKIIAKGTEQELWSILNGRMDPMTMTIADTSMLKTGSASSAIVPNGLGVFGEIIGGYEHYITAQMRNLMDVSMSDTMFMLDRMSSLNKVTEASQPLGSLKKLATNPKDPALVLKSTLLGDALLGEYGGWKWANSTFELGLMKGQQVYNEVFNGMIAPLTKGLFKNKSLSVETLQKADYEKLAKDLEAAGVPNPWALFDKEASSQMNLRSLEESADTSKRIIYASNALAASVALRIGELAQPLVNIMSLPILTYLAKQQDVPDVFLGAAKSGKKVPNAAQIMFEGARAANSPMWKKLNDRWEALGYFEPMISEANKTLHMSRSMDKGMIASTERALDSRFVEMASKPADCLAPFFNLSKAVEKEKRCGLEIIILSFRE
ncbi:predicted protein [Nematostella vectensis]|uniref:Uncharacterized protein n=1 Tax=Nematostella vectensis TaxID=45351 RepID=A7T4J0_NEMVE|nr:predicted protein [Nematostella vectensis]|eukprot:XP_001621226.1 hypothetical protein NEMVEDRAFT_v1g222229 [Nematostella vectensis]